MNEISNIHAFEDEVFLHACFVWGMAVVAVFAVCLVPVFMLLCVLLSVGILIRRYIRSKKDIF